MVARPASVALAGDGRAEKRAQPRLGLALPAVFRLCLLGLCLVLALATQAGATLPWLAVLLVLVVLSLRFEEAASRHAVLLGEVTLVCTGVALTGGATSPLLAYLLGPFLAVGLRHGQTYTVLYAGQAAALLILGRAITGEASGTWQAFSAAAAQWVVLSIAVGVLADRIRASPSQGKAPADASYEEALLLLGQLRNVTRRLPGSLDPVFVADAVLDSCATLATFQTAAVLVHTGDDRLAPLATRGMQRVPWRHPLTAPGPLQTAWLDARPVLDVRAPDVAGRRAGSALLALPVTVADQMIGLVVLESRQLSAFPQHVIEVLADNVQRQALRLSTAVVFDEFRSYASMEERERLARDMHDGVGQDLAAIGFELDELRRHLRGHDDALAHANRVRQHVTDMVRDIRLSITELQSGELVSRGLGAALTSHIRAAGAAGGFVVHLSLDESTFRLPADSEAELLRIAQEVTSAARRRFSAENVWVVLKVDPPAATLRMEHDGVELQEFPDNADLLKARVARVGGRIDLGTSSSSRAYMEIRLGGRTP